MTVWWLYYGSLYFIVIVIMIKIFLRSRLLAPKYTHFDSSSSLFQSQQSLKSQSNRKKSMLTIIFTGNREEAKWPKWSSSLLLPSWIKLQSYETKFGKSWPNKYLQLLLNQIEVSYILYIYIRLSLHNIRKIRTLTESNTIFIYKQVKKNSIYIRKWCNCKAP